MMLAERMDLLTKRPQGTLFPPAQNRAAWEALPADDRADIEAFIASWRDAPYPMLLLSDYAAFVRTGQPRTMRNAVFRASAEAHRGGIRRVPARRIGGFVPGGGWLVVHLRGNDVGDQRPCEPDGSAPVSYQRRTDTGLVRRADCHGAVLYADDAGRLA